MIRRPVRDPAAVPPDKAGKYGRSGRPRTKPGEEKAVFYNYDCIRRPVINPDQNIMSGENSKRIPNGKMHPSRALSLFPNQFMPVKQA